MARKKHKPQRTCIACREAQDKRGLIRIVRTPTQEIMIDPTGKANGRGAYLCHKTECWDKGLQKKLLANALKTTLSAADIERLKASLQTELSKV